MAHELTDAEERRERKDVFLFCLFSALLANRAPLML